VHAQAPPNRGRRRPPAPSVQPSAPALPITFSCPQARNGTRPQPEKPNPGTRDSPPVTSMPWADIFSKNYSRERNSPYDVTGQKFSYEKFFWNLRDGGHNEGVGAGSCHSGGETQKRNDGKFPLPKAKGKTSDKVAACDGVSGRTLWKAMAAGGKFGLVQGISMYTGGPLPCPAPEPKPLSVSHSGFGSTGPLR
jgi:hypothetical protein